MSVGQDFDEPLQRFIVDQVASGRFENADDVIRAALQLLQAQETEIGLSVEDIRREVQKGVDSGPGIPADEVFDRLKAKYQRMARPDAE